MIAAALKKEMCDEKQKESTCEELLLEIIDRTNKILDEPELEAHCEEVGACGVEKESRQADKFEESLGLMSVKKIEGEPLKSKIGEEDKLVSKVIEPSYGDPFNVQGITWLISPPLFLSNHILDDTTEYTGAFYLSKGSYKFKYVLINLERNTGLGLFNPDTKKLTKLLDYHPGSEPLQRAKGESYIQLKESRLIGITNEKELFCPRNFSGVIKLTIHKFKSSPK